MSYALPQILQPAIINETVSRLKLSNTSLQKFWGMQKGGSNVQQTPGRRGSYDIFNDHRNIPPMRYPGAAAATLAPQPVGNVPFMVPRIAFKIPLSMELLNNLRPIGGPASQVDTMGETYIVEQTRKAAEYIANQREFMLASLFRGSYTYTPSGDDLVQAFTGGSYTVNYQIPSGNLSQLNMLGAGSIISTAWSNNAADIPGNLYAIDAAFTQLCGRRLTDVWVTSKMWNYVLQNTEVHNLAGTAAKPFIDIARDAGDSNNFTAQLVGVPWVTFHVTNQGINISGTFTKLIDDTAAAFVAEPGPDVATLYECSEPVVEMPGQAPVARFGEYYYATTWSDPACYMLFCLGNFLPVLKNPYAIAYGTVNF
jgi:hypothetical protein